jgi:hypothetical protein
MIPLLFFVGALLIASEVSKKKKPGRAPSGEIPIGPGAEMFESIGGYLAYKPEVATKLIQSLIYRIATPIDQPNVILVQPGAGRPMGPLEWGAYYGLQALHDEGNALWVPLTFHWPEAAQTGQFVVFLPPGEAPPDEYAILILPDEPWPPTAS